MKKIIVQTTAEYSLFLDKIKKLKWNIELKRMQLKDKILKYIDISFILFSISVFNTSFSFPICFLFFLKYLLELTKNEIGIKIENIAPWIKLAFIGIKSNELILMKIELNVNEAI